jgi:D-tyrosyl-tRNA(Tyr) deacylase
MQVTIEINTNLPKKEPKEPKEPKDNKQEEEIKKTFEFQIPAELLE